MSFLTLIVLTLKLALIAPADAKTAHSLVIKNEETGKALLTQSDFTQGETELRKGKVILKMTLTAEGAKHLQAYTSLHPNAHLPIELDQRVIAQPRVRGPFTGNAFEIDALTQDEASEISAMIHH